MAKETETSARCVWGAYTPKRLREMNTRQVYTTNFPDGLFCPYGKVMCHPTVIIELWPVNANEPVPYKLLDRGLWGIKMATFEEASAQIVKNLMQWCYCSIRVTVEESCLRGVTESIIECDEPFTHHDYEQFEDGSGGRCKRCGCWIRTA